MRIDIQAKGFDPTEGLRKHALHRLQFASDCKSSYSRKGASRS